MFRRALSVLLFAAVLSALMTAVRLLLVEPDEMAVRCSAVQMGTLACRVRGWAIQGFSQHLFGPISVIAAVLGWIGGSVYLSILAMMVGMAGVVLYDFDYAAVGLLLGALFLSMKNMKTPTIHTEPSQPQRGGKTQ